ncbi:DUF2975 domain-containing protein [Mariniflexile litorale]|uniref:DUF2975 domain-containing protein n=1 Tax=Mariniflexile litorale TaxID=3045158 RepID=A0AAU7EIW9_9FLAO|nr:DUF2975 domain-containing protein [Mariniflexile sp. KMM 9835]MDQ8211121.1 DUF2975 domain-containing protein [Mariniflexile sp. KMM 9835]
MKTIKKLKSLIDILFFILIGIAILQLLFWGIAYFFTDLLFAPMSNNSVIFKMLFSTFFNWRMFFIPLTIAVNFVLFIIAISFLRKSVSLFMQSDFYNNQVIKNFKIVGSLFVFIGVSSIIVQLFFALYFKNTIKIEDDIFIKILSIASAAIDLKSIFSIVIGLFFLLFSKIFENSRILKQENELTI